MDQARQSDFEEAGPAAPALGEGEVHVWRLLLEQPSSRFDELRRILDQEEQGRVDRFRFDIHRQRYIAAHAGLRLILSRYLKIQPQAIQFQFTQYGKPGLTPGTNPAGIAFNLSHSHELGLIAVAQNRTLGVDIEQVRADLADEKVARRFFSAREIEALLSLPPELQRVAFFNCWTRKEAYIKARGEGLSLPLDQFDVTLIPGEPAILLHTRPDPAQALQWKLYDLNPGSGYAAALAVEGFARTLKCWQWLE